MKKLEYRKYCLIIVSLVLFPIASGIGQTYITGGDVSGTWSSAGSPYYIQGEITIPNSETLTIEPGVNVVFLGHYKLNVQGRLLAVGTQQDSISFTADSIEIGWHGIRFMNTPNTNDTSKMVYCSFKYGKANTGNGYDRSGGAIMINGFDKVLVSNCLFDSNLQIGGGWDPIEAGPAIYFIYSSPIITNSTFSNNIGDKGAAISCLTSQNAIISNNVFSNNWGGLVGPIIIRESGTPIISGNIIFDNYAGYMGGGIAIEMGSTPRIENNIIFHNWAPDAGGIICWIDVNAIIINNTIAYNVASYSGGGIRCDYNSDAILLNNIIYGNSASVGSQVYIYDDNSDPNFFFSDIQGGKEGFGGSGAGSNYSGLYENNIDADPLFVNVTSDDFRLTDYSPCIGTGIDSIEISGVWYYVPPFCIGGNPRPNPAGSMPDIGACENDLPFPIPVELISFVASVNGKEITLNWSTATEVNNQGFEIQRNREGEEFFTVGFVNGHGTTTEPQNYSYAEKNSDNGKYYYRLKQVDYNGSFEYSDAIEVDFRAFNSYLLEQNYPNPFNPTTIIGFGLQNKSNVKITILNAIGEEVAVVLNEEREPGFYQVEFSAIGGSASGGNAYNLPSGVYFYQLRAGEFKSTKKMILLR
jgi:parallel beta-helix repeat protein